MTWTKISDDYSDDCWELSDAAYRLHTEGLVWSNRKLLDGRLDKGDVRRWAKRPEAADELVAVGWWKDDGNVYVIVHHAVYQRTREAVLAQQDANQKNGQRGGRPKGPPRERPPRKRPTKTDSLSESASERVSDRGGSALPETDSLSDSPTERDWTGQDRPGQQNRGTSLSADSEENAQREERPVVSQPVWRGVGPDPFEEYR